MSGEVEKCPILHVRPKFDVFILLSKLVWIQIRLDIMLGLIYVQIVCKVVQQTTLVGKELMCNTPRHKAALLCNFDLLFLEIM